MQEHETAITLNLNPELETGLLAQWGAAGTTSEDYVGHLVGMELSSESVLGAPSEGSGIVWEGGLFIYGARTAIPSGFSR